MTDDLIDEMAVELAMEGDTDVPLTAKEMKAAWRRPEARNLDVSEIADLLGVTPRTVFRWRQGMTPVSRPGRSARRVATGATATVTTPPVQPSPPAQTLEARLAEGIKSQLKSVQQAAKKAHEALERFCQVEREERSKSAARAEIAWLERELREAKAKLRAKPAVTEPSAPPASPLANQAAIRGWCVAQGIEVPAKGRLPREAVEA